MVTSGIVSAVSFAKTLAMQCKGGNETPGWKVEWDAISDAVWESLRRSHFLHEDDEESGDDMFFTPPESPSQLDPGFAEPCICSTWGFSGVRVLTPTERVLHLHHRIVGQLIGAVEGTGELRGGSIQFNSSLE